MAQETIRFSESIVEEVNTLVDKGVFENKSEFYRFAAELVLESVGDDYDPEMVNYDRLTDSLSAQIQGTDQASEDVSGFYRSAITIRRYARQGDITAAEKHIDNHYPPERGEYLLLEALLDYYHQEKR